MIDKKAARMLASQPVKNKAMTWALDAIMWRERAEAERQRAERARDGLRDVIHHIRDDFGSYAIATANDVLAATEPAEEGK